MPDTIEKVDDSILSEIILCEAWDSDKNPPKTTTAPKLLELLKMSCLCIGNGAFPCPENAQILDILKCLS